MAETTTDEMELTREETATYLRSIADQLNSRAERIGIPIGNKEVQLSPPETIEMETTVTERSRRLRKDSEELSLRFKWNPTKDTAESETEADAQPGSDGGLGSDTDR